MLRRLVVLIAGLIFLTAVAEAGQKREVVPNQVPLLYSLSLKEQVLRVKISCPAVATGSVVFGIGKWAGVRDFYAQLFDVEAKSDTGETLKIEKPFTNQWVVFHKGKAFSLEYVVSSPKTSFMGFEEKDRFRPTLLKDLIFLWGYSYLLKPCDELLGSLPIRFHLDEKSLGNSHSSFPNDVIFASAHEMTDSLIISGDFRHFAVPIMGIQVEFSLSGKKWDFSDQEFVTLFGKIMSSQARSMLMYPTERMMVVLAEGGPGSNGGTVVKNAITVYPSPGEGSIQKNAAVLKLAAHEHFHLWNGHYIHPASGHKEGYYKWFEEGFTDYFAQSLLASEGIISAEEFRLWMNNTIQKYYANPYAMALSNDDLEKNYWMNDYSIRLPYEKGAVIAFIFDQVIRKSSNNTKTLSDYFRALLQNTQVVSQGYDPEVLEKTLIELSNASIQAFFEECVMGCREIPFEELTVKWSLSMKKEKTKAFELGFEVNKSGFVKGARITKVVHGSAAEKAGICLGDIIDGIAIYHGNPAKEVKLDCTRDGKKQTIRYFPAKELFIFQLVAK